MALPFETGQLVAPPIPNETAFYLRFFAEVASIRDRAGRPLHEVDFRAEIGPEGVRPCPYAGSRRGRKMNWEALQVIAAEWRVIVEIMQYLKWGVSVEDEKRTPGELAWARALLPMFLPLFAWRKGRGQLPAEVTTAVSGLFKVMLDVPTTLDLMLASEWAGMGAPEYTPNAIVGYAESTSILNNGEWTCAGPPGLIGEVLRLVCERGETRLASAPPHCLELDLEKFGAFASIMTRQYALSQAFQLATAFAMEQAFAQIFKGQGCDRGGPVALSAYERRRRIFLGLCRDASSCRAVISGFLRLSLEPGHSKAAGSAKACVEELLGLTRVGGSPPVDILEAQTRAESSVRSAVNALQQECLGLLDDPSSRPSVDFSRLDADHFPSRILRRRLGHR